MWKGYMSYRARIGIAQNQKVNAYPRSINLDPNNQDSCNDTKPLQFEKTLLTICESFCGFYRKAFIINTTVTFETTVTFDRVKQIEP